MWTSSMRSYIVTMAQWVNEIVVVHRACHMGIKYTNGVVVRKNWNKKDSEGWWTGNMLHRTRSFGPGPRLRWVCVCVCLGGGGGDLSWSSWTLGTRHKTSQYYPLDRITDGDQANLRWIWSLNLDQCDIFRILLVMQNVGFVSWM